MRITPNKGAAQHRSAPAQLALVSKSLKAEPERQQACTPVETAIVRPLVSSHLVHVPLPRLDGMAIRKIAEEITPIIAYPPAHVHSPA